MSGHPGVMGVTADPPVPAGAGPRELGPGLEGAAWRAGDPPLAGRGASQESYYGVARCQ
jgi:hypothetical protein